MTVVLDASAAMDVALYGEASRFAAWIQDASVVLAPDLFVAEITNAFWKYRQFNGVDDETCSAGIEVCLSMVDGFVESGQLHHEVFHEAARQQHSAYDVFYLVCARRNGATLLTRDRKLRAVATAAGVKIPPVK